jgi:hypothetical protein
MRHNFTILVRLACIPATALLLQGCSVDIIPVHSERVTSVKMAEEPMLRGPNAPGAFKYDYSFASPKGYLFDPTELEFVEGSLHFKDRPPTDPLPKGEHQALLLTSRGPSYVALDAFQEILGPNHRGTLAYQLSKDNAAWYYHKDGAWIPAGPSKRQANSAAEVQAAIPKFHVEVGIGALFLKVFVISPTGAEPIDLKGIQVQGVSPRN